jgi:parvulin-like peptidyl-prolyl isomerase
MAIRAEVEKAAQRASIEYLALRRREFDGRYREPRESEIVAPYSAHPERYRRPAEATLSVIVVNRPTNIDSVDATDAGYRAWDEHAHARADSAIAAIRAGATFADLAPIFGGVKNGARIRRDQVPDFWNGTPTDLAAVLAATPGTVLPEPVRSGTGWAVVRVDASAPARQASLREVAPEIRSALRASAKAAYDDGAIVELYNAIRDSLRDDAYRLRYALADTASFTPHEPSAQELEQYYRAHVADYMSYSKSSGMVVEKPLASVRDEVRGRWMRDRRQELTRGAAERVRDAWTRGRRDPPTERSLTMVREIGPVPAGGEVDTGRAGPDLVAVLATMGKRPGVTMSPVGAGYLVVDLREVIPGYVPTFEQARPMLTEELASRRSALEEDAARRAFEADPTPYRMPATIEFTRAVIEPPELLDVPLTRDEVDRFYRAHLKDYSVEELVHVRHILISPLVPGPAADAAARAKAEDIVRRVRAGEDFAKLAAQFSDDPATRENGGDVGVFRHGKMREEFERAAFAMRPGDITGPVHTDVGYHIMECLEYMPAVIHPLVEVYANVAQDCARKKADRISGQRADSLYRTLKSVADAKAMAKRLDMLLVPSEHPMGRHGLYGEELQAYIRKIETMKPGQLYPGTQFYSGLGTVITWVDSIAPPRLPTWQEARDRALARYRREGPQRAMQAKRAELDSLVAGGWSLDSLATLWGGFETSSEAMAGTELRGLGGPALLDSLVFGKGGEPVLQTGKVSEWVEFPGGLAKLRVAERLEPDPADFARRVEIRRQIVLWRNLNAYFDRIKARYPVEIHDVELRATSLPEPTEP